MRKLLILTLMCVGACGGSDKSSGGSGGTSGGMARAGNGGSGSGGKMARMPKPPRPAAVTSSAAPSEAPMDTTATSAGVGGLKTNTAQDGDTGDETWLLQEDVDGDGVPDDVYVIVDDETGNKYVWFEGTIDAWCTDGSNAAATYLTIFTDGKQDSTVLFETDCPEDANLTFGCDVDSDGNPSACGVCAIDDASGEWVCAAADATAGSGS